MIYYWIDKKSTLGHGENRIPFGEKIPEGMLKKDRIEKFKKSGQIGELPVEASAELAAKVEANKKKAASGGDKPPTKAALKAEAKALYAEMAGLENEDPRIAEIETRISEIEEALK